MESVLTKDEIKENHDRFISLLKSITRQGYDADYVIDKLEKSDFFIAPASTMYHQSYEGGLCRHCLQVYDNLELLMQSFCGNSYSEDTIRIVSLFHDIAKMDFYEVDMRNVKVDNQWVKEPYYKVAKEHFIFGSHESTCLYILQHLMPLSDEEAVAILHHHGGLGWDSAKDNIADVFTKYPLAMYLHFADSISAYDK